MTQIATFTADGARKGIKDLDEGSNVIRIIPGFGRHAATGKYREYYRLEFGYRTSEDYLKPFQGATQFNRDGKVSVEGAAYKRRMELEKIHKQLKDAVDAVGEAKAPADLLEKKKQVGALLQRYNSKGVHVLNVVSIKGDIFCQKMPQTAWKALKEKIDKVKAEYGFDPILIKGCFFEIVKTKAGPNGRDTTYSANIYMEPIPGGGLGQTQLRMHELTPDIINRLEKEAWDLETVYPTLTPEEEERVVHGGPAAVDAILGKPRTDYRTETASSAPAQAQAQAPVQATTTPAPVTAPVTQVAPVQAPVQTTPAQSTADLLASIGQTQQASTPPVGTTASAPADKPAGTGVGPDMEAFLQGLGV
jgi:hypothetical protein